MPLDFPPSPAVNEIYPFGGRYWIWNGTAWDSYNPSASNVVTQLNGLTGGVTLAAGSNITLTPSGNTITIASSGGGGISGPYVISFNGLTGTVTGVSSVRGLTGTVGISAGLGITLSTSGQTLTISNLVTNENTSISDHYLAFYGVTSGIANPKVDSGLRYVPFQNNILGDGGLILRGLSAGGVANQNTLVLNDPNNDGIVFYTADNNILVSNFSGVFGDITSLSLVSWDFMDIPRTATIAPIATYTGDQTFTLPDDSGTIALTKNVVSSFNGSTGAVTGVRSIRGLTGAVGITNGSGIGLSVSGQTMTFSNTGVLSFNGLTGAVTGVSSVRGLTGAIGITNGSGIGLSVSGQTMTFSNTGVLSINGGTGAITNVARTNVANIFTANQSISTPNASLRISDSTTLNEVEFQAEFNRLYFYDDLLSGEVYFQPTIPSLTTITVSLPGYDTILAGLAGTQTFTGTNTFNTLTNFPGGISAAGGTFSSLARFNAGISAAGGTFSSQARFLSGITVAGGATFATDISVNGMRVGLGAGNQLYNVALGANTLTTNTIGDYNLAIGADSLQSNLDGTDNIALGYGSLTLNSSGINNVSVGSSTLFSNTTGSYNTAVGVLSLGNISTGNDNVGIGYNSLGAINTGKSQNTAIGSQAGYYRGTASLTNFGGTGGIYIGYQSRASASAQTNEIVIGTQAVGLGSNTAVIGATAQTAATIYGLLNLPGGISAAGGTFSSLTRFTAGLSASNGMTLTGTMSLNGQTFTNVVSSINGLTGSINLAAGSNITITPSGLTLTIASTGGGGGGDVSSVQGLTGDVILSAVTLYMFDLGIV